jgi:hypothetical protein
MKYNQASRKAYLEDQLKDIFLLLGIDELEILNINFKKIRVKLNEVYPFATAPNYSLDYPSNSVIFRDRKKIMNNSRHILYELNAIRKREQNGE